MLNALQGALKMLKQLVSCEFVTDSVMPMRWRFVPGDRSAIRGSPAGGLNFSELMTFHAFFRCARKKDPDHEPIMAWVDAADMMYLTGLEQYSESVFLQIAYANFLSTYKKSKMVRTSGA